MPLLLRPLLSGVTLGLLLSAPLAAQSAEDGFICDTDKHHIVIDHGGDGTLRYRAWNRPRAASLPPDVEVHGGTSTTGGTDPCMSTDWTFRRGHIEYLVSDSAACTEGRPPPNAHGLVMVSINGQFAARYWCVR